MLDKNTQKYKIKIISIGETYMPNPHPTLVSLSPASALAGSPSFTLTVNGANFISSSVISFDNQNLATTFINSTQLTALVTASLISSGKSKHVEVITPTPGGGESRDLVFVLYTNLIKVVTNTSGMQLVLNVPGDNVNNLVTIAANAISFDLGSVLSNDDLVAVQPTLVGLAKNNAIQVVSTAPEITYNQAATPVVASSPFVKAPVRLAAITPLPANTYNNGASGVGATLTANSGIQLTVDQTLANVGDRILVAGEATASHNGIYTVSNIGQNATGTSISLPTGTDHGAVSNTSFADGLFNLSTSFWIKTTDAGNFRRILDKANDAVGGGGWEIYLLTGGFLWVTFRDPSSNSYQVFTTSAS
ncbi:MAG TPA: IPT/TIG domain-containing protein, partial [Bacteroidia bacterium]|nr:IPT/TIG domain-containing protein [Bacteroidia bacterium]